MTQKEKELELLKIIGTLVAWISPVLGYDNSRQLMNRIAVLIEDTKKEG